MADDRPARRFFVLLLVLTTLALALVVRPLASALFIAAVLAAIMAPLHARMAARLRGRPRLAAGILVFALVVVLLGPLVGLAAFLIREGNEALKFVAAAVRSDSVAHLVAKLPDSLEKIVGEALARLQDVDRMVEGQLGAQGGKAAAAAWSALSATGSVIFAAVMMLIALFFFLVQGGELVSWLDDTSPLRPGQTRELLAEFRKVSFSVIASSIITSGRAGRRGVDRISSSAGCRIRSSSRPITFFVAFVPALGAASVCLFAAGILYVTGHPYWSLFLALWGLVVVGLVDNVIKPLLIKAGMEMRSAVVFFSLIGGLAAFGAIGLIVGPLVVALFLALLRIYRRDFKLQPDARV